MEYKIKKEDKKNPLLSTIEITGLSDVVSIKDILDNIDALQKQISELDSKIRIERATMQNVVSNYKDINDLLPSMSDSKEEKDRKNQYLVALFIFLKSRDFIHRAEPVVKERKKIIKEEQDNLEKIKESTGIDYKKQVVDKKDLK